MYAVCTQGYHPKAYLTSPGRLQRSSRLRLQDEVGRAAAAADGAAATVEEGDLHTVFLTHLAGAPATWQCVKTNSTPLVHIKIAGIYGCSSP